MSVVDAVTKEVSAARAYALDALRGLAILSMLLSGQLPFGDHSLPSWMYHAQVPPPNHIWNGNLPGITWVDLVFPMFLFSMGAAFPLALSRRLEKEQEWRVYIDVMIRGALLGFFALYVDAIRPYVLSNHPDWRVWLAALAGFVLLFPILARLPQNWPAWLKLATRSAGWAGAIVFLALARYPDGSSFSLGRSDIIIVVLANIALFGAIIWLLTRDRPLIRLGLLGILCAIRLSNMPKPVPGLVHDMWAWSPAPWIYQLYYLQYLFIAIPGTIAGEIILNWLRSRNEARKNEPQPATWAGFKSLAVAIVMAAMVITALIGLKARWLVQTTIALGALCVIGWLMVRDAATAAEKMVRTLFGWAIYWLILGLFFEPYEGGIKKDKATMSYYFVTTALAICLLIFFVMVFEFFGKRKWAAILVDNGQNPMIAYAGINNLVIPVLALTRVDLVLNAMVTNPWMGFLKGLIITLLVAMFVSVCTRMKIFWRT